MPLQSVLIIILLLLLIGAELESLTIFYLSGTLCLAAVWPLLYRLIGKSLQYYFANVLRFLTKRVSTYLSAHDALLGGMTAFGMSCFVLGNALQFVATL